MFDGFMPVVVDQGGIPRGAGFSGCEQPHPIRAIQTRQPGDPLDAIGGERSATPVLDGQKQQAGHEGNAVLTIPGNLAEPGTRPLPPGSSPRSTDRVHCPRRKGVPEHVRGEGASHPEAVGDLSQLEDVEVSTPRARLLTRTRDLALGTADRSENSSGTTRRLGPTVSRPIECR